MDEKRTTSPTSSSGTSQKPAKKRTKTGCLTCRKRRIKCKEEKPVCSNCVKSRRQCEYTKFQWSNPDDNSPIQYDSIAQPSFSPHQLPSTSQYLWSSASQGNVEIPYSEDRAAFATPSLPTSTSGSSYPHYVSWPPASAPPWSSGDHLPPQQRSPHENQAYLPRMASDASISPPGRAMGAPQYSHHQLSDMGHFVKDSRQYPRAGDGNHAPMQWPVQMGGQYAGAGDGRFVDGQLASRASRSSETSMEIASPATPYQYSPTGFQHSQQMLPQPHGYLKSTSPHGQPHASDLNGFLATQHYILSELALDARGGLYGLDATQSLDLAAVEYQDDDYYDVFSGEDSDALSVSSLAVAAAVPTNDVPSEFDFMRSLARQLTVQRLDPSQADCLYAGAIDHYRPERSANPLRNADTRRVFAHFISTTAPMLSPYERPIKFSPSFRAKTNLPPTPLSLWTFTLPMRALHHQGLLHAMLAMSSLHIARKDGASVTPSYKHYSWSIKKIHKQVSKQKPGTVDIEILAATLLLSFYEVMTADLHKWLPHLCGARQLLSEVDFPGMSRQLHRMKLAKGRKKPKSSTRSREEAQEDAILHRFQNIDPKNLDIVMGRKRARDKFGWPIEAGESEPDLESTYSLVELSAFEILQDMWWWYLKQDGIFSYLSADPTMMEYNLWSRCPPRCDLGKANCVYGAYDWAIILLGRTSDFAARDISRKLRQNEFNGNRFPPAPFFGLGPSAARTMPTAYGPVLPKRAPPKPIVTREELTTATAEACKEWQEIKSAIDLVESKLDAAYPALREDEVEHWDTPFGRSIRYECDNIAGMLLNVKMARLQHARTHPYMPPSMIMACAAAAHQTKDIIAEMGRIMAGVNVSMSCVMSTDPAWAGAFADCCLPLYAAGLQVTDAAQREFVITRLFEIEGKSGNASAGLCAAGCESSWERAGLEGRGPVYVKRRADMEARKRLYRRLDGGVEGDPREMTVPLVYRS